MPEHLPEHLPEHSPEHLPETVLDTNFLFPFLTRFLLICTPIHEPLFLDRTRCFHWFHRGYVALLIYPIHSKPNFFFLSCVLRF